MENRLLLAFVLSLVMFFLWGWFLSVFYPPQKAPPQVAEQPEPGGTAPQPSLPPAQAPEAEPALPLPAPAAPQAETKSPAEETKAPAATPGIPEQLIRVHNKDLTYTFSNRGAVIRSVLTERLKDKAGRPLELVKHLEGADYPLTLKTDQPGVNRLLKESLYQTDAPEEITLSEGQPRLVMHFTLEHPTGFRVERTLTLEYGNPLFQMQTEVKGQVFAKENLEYRVVWGPGLGGAKESQADYIVFSGPTTFVNNERIEDNPKEMSTDRVVHSGELMWTGFQNKYFAAALVPQKGVKAAVVEKKTDDEVYVGLLLESVQSSARLDSLVYVGTKELEVLERSGHKLVRLIDYGWFGNKFAFLVKPILKALNWFYGLTGNYGWSIILLTFVIKLLFFPLTHKSFKSMKGMQKIQPYIKIIQERNKNDRQKMNEEMLELYRKHKVNPLGGCLPILLQIPVFIALYHTLFFSIELRGAPFILWIQDLSEKDPYFVTPVVMGATMLIQQKLTPSTMDPVQQKIMLMMPVIFTFLFITFPSGLVIYWTVNNLLTIAQQYYIYHIAKD